VAVQAPRATHQYWAKVSLQEISDMLMEKFRKAEAEEKKEAKRKKKKPYRYSVSILKISKVLLCP
jgi:hypothetical protein